MSLLRLRMPLLAGLALAMTAGPLALGRTKSKAAKSADGPSSLGGTFDIDRLPPGANVTIPRPATTLVPSGGRIVLTATDIPQTVSFKPVSRASGASAPLRLSIFDPHAGRVQYVDLRPGTPFLYNFKELDSITVLPEASGSGSGTSLQVESDKPLQIAH